MPVKKRNDTWAAAPESSYPKHGSLRTDAKNLHARLLTGLAVVVTMAAGAGIFIALNAPRSPSASVPTTVASVNVPANPVSLGATPASAPAPVVAPDQTTQSTPVRVTTASSAQVPVQSPATDAPAPAPVIAPQLVAAAAAGPAIPDTQAVQAHAPVRAVTSQGPSVPAQSAPPATSPSSTNVNPVAETGIRNTTLVIGGRTYECYGQVAHLACDLKQ